MGKRYIMDRFFVCGDFRERRAVVRLRDGLCTHIGEDGAYTHSMLYYDLDVYHKGFARARDERGWTHIDGDGMPLYDRRFAMAEPFYNGRALRKPPMVKSLRLTHADEYRHGAKFPADKRRRSRRKL